MQQKIDGVSSDYTLKRANIVAKFSELKLAVETCERSTLATFDTQVNLLLKALRAEAGALVVTNTQFAAQVALGIDVLTNMAPTRSLDSTTVDFVDLLQDLNEIISDSSMVVQVAVGQNEDNSDHKFLDLAEKKVNLVNAAIGRFTSAKNSIWSVHSQVASELTVKALSHYSNNDALSSTTFQRRPIAAFEVSSQIPPTNRYSSCYGGPQCLAVNACESCVAVCWAHAVALYAVDSCEILRSFHKAGQYDFRNLASLCFVTPATHKPTAVDKNQNLLVVDSQTKMVHEITLFGDHVRCIGSAAQFRSTPTSVSAEHNTVVVGQPDSLDKQVSIFHRQTGECLRSFAVGRGFRGGLRALRGGDYLFVAQVSPNSVSMYSVDGQLIQRIRLPGFFQSIRDVAVNNSRNIVTVIKFRASLAVMSCDGTVRKDLSVEGGFTNPIAIAPGNRNFYVLDGKADHGFGRVTVFE